MKKLLLIALCATATCWAEFTWPTQQVPVRIDGQLVDATWKDGKPFVDREASMPVLHIRSGPDQVDLAEVLASRGYVLVQQADGTIECKRPSTAGPAVPGRSAPLVIRPAPRNTARSTMDHQRDWTSQQRQAARAPRLVASSYRYVADTEYIRAFCVVQNVGGGPSPSCLAVGEFADWYGRPFARDSHPLPPLSPGESVEMTFFSMVHKDESQPNGVIKADQYKCQVRFVGPGLDDSGVAAKRNPTGAYRPSAAVKARVKSTDFHVESSTVKFTPHKQTVLPPGTTLDANGFPRRIP